MVTVSMENATLQDLNILNLAQKPYRAFLQYWSGTEQDFNDYMRKHNLDYDFKASNIKELSEKSDQFLLDFAEAVRKDIGNFDFRLRASLGNRNLKPLELDDYSKITLKNDTDNTQELINTFLKFNSRSFIDFRDFDNENNELTFIYNRRGIFDENERIAILKARNSITMSDNFQQAKDNNFILSGLCYELAKAHNIDFKNEAMFGDTKKEFITTASKILGVAEKLEAQKEGIITQSIAKEQAKQEIKQENSATRQSLNADSTEAEVLKEGNTEIRIQPLNQGLRSAGVDEFVNKSIEIYEQKELEKLKLRLEKSRKEAESAYIEMQNKINEGMTIYESINYIKQKYRNEEHTVNIASALLTKDILNVNLLKNELVEEKAKSTELSNQVEDKNNEITKREETITSLKSTMQTKVNEFNLEREKHNEQLEAVKNEAKSSLSKMQAEFNDSFKRVNEAHKRDSEKYLEIIAQKDEELSSQDEIILRLKAKNEELEKKNKEFLDLLKTQNQNLEKKNDEIVELLKSFNAKNNLDEVKENNDLNKEKSIFIKENDNLPKKNDIMLEEKDIKNKSIEELNKILDDAKVSNDIKREILANLSVDDILNSNEEGKNNAKNTRRQ